MRLGDTIVAIASAPGRSARGIVRASGPEVQRIHQEWLGAPWPGRGASARRMRLRGAELPCLALTYEVKASFTDEDLLELLLPGNPELLERVLEQLTTMENVRRAGPGEFTARAYLNGRLSLDQAEGVAMTIAARSGEELDAARRTLLGETGARCRTLTDEIAAALALVEAGIDFADQEDVVAISPRDLMARLTAIKGELLTMLGGAARREPPRTARVAIVGRPNAGKSTLFNALLGRERAVVSEAPGTTRDAIVETLNLSDAAPGAGDVELVDLAGLDAALTGAVDRAAQQAARGAIAQADALIHCDPSGRFDLRLDAGDTPMLRVRTKADLPHEAPSDEEFAVCALDGWNLGALKRAIADAACGSASGATAARHAETLRRAADAVNSAIERVSPQQDARHLTEVELIALDLREALDAVGAITGRVTPDDVIGRIFASFCIGK